MMDSKKHAGLYKAAAYIMEGRSFSLMEKEFVELGESQAPHRKGGDVGRRQCDYGRDRWREDQKDFFMMIYDDELMHHPFMVTFLDVVLKREFILEQDIWDMLFKNLPTNGHVADPYVGKDYGPYFSGFFS